MMGLTLDLPSSLKDEQAARTMAHMAVDAVIDNLLAGQHATLGVFKADEGPECTRWCVSVELEPVVQPVAVQLPLMAGLTL